jgi:acetyl esterase/lipase
LGTSLYFTSPTHGRLTYAIQTSEHVKDLGINPQKGFIVGGISAGANLAAVVAHLYRDKKHVPALTGQYLCIPTTCDPVALPEKYKDVYLSREQNKDGLILNQKSIDMFEGTSARSD